MPFPPILRTDCKVDYQTPSGGTLSLDVNCAGTDSLFWEWKYFHTKTIGTATPITSNGTSRSLTIGSASFEDNEECPEGQTVMRAIFAYIADQDFSVNVELEVEGNPDTPNLNPLLLARLYSATGGQVTEYINTTQKTASQTIILPATVCPKVLWLGVAIQPTVSIPLPATTGRISFSVV
mgnify:CR=1 FL=1